MSAEVGRGTSIRRLEKLARELFPYHLRYERGRDARAVFAYVYYNITLDLAERVAAPAAGFLDPGFVAELAVAFGGRYRAAADAIDDALSEGAGELDDEALERALDAVPRPWADVYLAQRGGRSYVLEDLLYSMMAHISYDLPLALGDVGARADHLADYHRMNAVLAERTEFIQDRVAERYQTTLAKLDRLAGSFDEFFTSYGIRGARSVAWYNAQRLLSPPAAADARASIERSTRSFIRAVRRPEPAWLRLLVRAARLLVPPRRRWPEPPEPSPRPSRAPRPAAAGAPAAASTAAGPTAPELPRWPKG